MANEDQPNVPTPPSNESGSMSTPQANPNPQARQPLAPGYDPRVLTTLTAEAALNPPEPVRPPKKPGQTKKIVIITLIVISVLLLSVTATLAIMTLIAKPKPIAREQQPSCTPPTASKLDKTNAMAAFKPFAQAIKRADQTCADSLSSDFFKQLQKQSFPSGDGKWITASVANADSITKRFTKLPATLDDAGFTQVDYIRPKVTTAGPPPPPNPTPADLPKGITLSYPLTDERGIEYSINIAFITGNNKVMVDGFELRAMSLTPVAAKALAQANITAIATYLEVFAGNAKSSYPSDINPATFDTLGPSVDKTVFTPPVGIRYEYSATPQGCTTASKKCKRYTLSAVSTLDGSTFASTSQ